MSRVVLVHGAFHELWGPNELKARWLPAVRDGLWHHGLNIDENDVGVCFYGDLFRLDLEVLDLDEWEKSRAVVAHSMGTVIAHQTLAANPQIEIDTLVTLGSPLGSDMIFPMLEPAIDGPLGPWPGGVTCWVNVAAHGDKDHLVDNGYRAHDALPYLNAACTGAAIGRALGP